MTVIFPEFVDAVFGENCFDEIVAIRYQDLRDNFDDEEAHALLQGQRYLEGLVGHGLHP